MASLSDTSSLTLSPGAARDAKVISTAFAVQAVYVVDKAWAVTVGHKTVKLKECILTPGNGKGFTDFVSIEDLSSCFLSATLEASVCFGSIWSCRMVWQYLPSG
jgi:hypothetical protein